MNIIEVIKSYKYQLIIVILIAYIIIYNASVFDKYSTNSYHHFESQTKQYKPSKDVIILAWTQLFNGYICWPFINHKLNCAQSNCLFTSNQSLFSRSNAVLFHWRDLNDNNIPNKRYPNQTWLIFNLESPAYSVIEHKDIFYKSEHFYHQINWTMSYRYDSDIVASYGNIVKCDNKNREINYRFETKTKSIAWIVSNCNTFSGREKYVAELQKYIDVDIYGKCGNFSCKKHTSCLEMIEQKYKFYLSFENTICTDYVTEKLFKILKLDIIPIVLGGANYTAIMPEHSYINVFNFSSPKLLAHYLNSVGSDPQLYDSYFSWKNNYCIIPQSFVNYNSFDNHKAFCDLCYKLNFPHSFKKSLTNTSLIDWWYEKGNCRTLEPYDNNNAEIAFNLNHSYTDLHNFNYSNFKFYSFLKKVLT